MLGPNDKPSDFGYYGLVYLATNKINGKVYVGITIKSLAKRRAAHIQDSRGRCEYRFHPAIKKYGEDAFIWAIIDTGNSEEELNALEIYYIDKYQSIQKEKGYNLTKGGDGCHASPETAAKISASKIGFKHTEEAKKKMSESGKERVKRGEVAHLTEGSRKKIGLVHKGKAVSLETRSLLSSSWHPHSYPFRAVIQLDKEGNILGKFDSIKAASKATGYSDSAIGNVCRGKALSCGGWIWKFDDERSEELKREMDARPMGQKANISDEERQRRVAAATGKHPSEETRKKQSEAHKLNPPSEKTFLAAHEARKRPVQQLDSTGNVVAEFPSIKEAALGCNLRLGGLSKALHAENNLYKGFFWRFKTGEKNQPTKKRNLVNNRDKAVVQLDFYENIIAVFPSIAEASRKINIDPTVISKACRRDLRTAGGFIWKYKGDIKND